MKNRDFLHAKERRANRITVLDTRRDAFYNRLLQLLTFRRAVYSIPARERTPDA
jgi:hypothetical protein